MKLLLDKYKSPNALSAYATAKYSGYCDTTGTRVTVTKYIKYPFDILHNEIEVDVK